MSTTIHVQLAEAIRDELADTARGWHTVSDVSRTWRPWYQSAGARKSLEDKLQIAVVPMAIARKRAQRPRMGNNGNEYDFAIGIDLQKLIDVADPEIDAKIDALDLIAEQIADFYQDGHTIMTGYVAMGADREDVYSTEMLFAEQIWETYIAVGVKGFR